MGRKDNHRGRRPAVWSPSEYLVIDWAEAAPELFVFCAVLAFSRWRFVRFAADRKVLPTLAMIAEALAVIGRVPAKVLADRMGCLKGGVVANVVVPRWSPGVSVAGLRLDRHVLDHHVSGHREPVARGPGSAPQFVLG
ncbi:hypothetical protein MBOT_32600 [Mycobacterium botniense]|uniref:Transposase n=1 Tax=Mycobacterium botniense TaxID=84962 RepID=A0A7I9Y1E9_9MYCO|nr:hypothetical protein MBOT_32600 [Mycobacterium botniense]